MIQRSLLRNVGARSFQLRSLSRPLPPSLPFSLIRTISSPLPRRTAVSRQYSTPTEINANTDASTSQAQASENGGEEQDPLKKELQAKEREIIDLKVRPPPPKILPSFEPPFRPS